MTKDQIAEQRDRFYEYYKNDATIVPERDPFTGRFVYHITEMYFSVWLAAKQDAAEQKNEFCRYCGTGNEDHLPNCKGK